MAVRVKRRRGFTRLSPKHQVTLPSEALTKAGIRVGDELAVSVDEQGRVVLSAATDLLERLIGSAPGLSAGSDLQALRNEWDR